MEAPNEVIMPTEIANKMMAYLATRPCNETMQLILEIQQTTRPYVAPTAPEGAPAPEPSKK